MMKKFFCVLLVLCLFCSEAFALEAWETGEMPYRPEEAGLNGYVFWKTNVYGRQTRQGYSYEMLYVMNLETGHITKHRTGDEPVEGYPVRSDPMEYSGLLIAEKSDDLITMYEIDREGQRSPLWSCTIECGPGQSVNMSKLSYIGGWLYYYVIHEPSGYEAQYETLHRTDLNGNFFDYSPLPKVNQVCDAHGQFAGIERIEQERKAFENGRFDFRLYVQRPNEEPRMILSTETQDEMDSLSVITWLDNNTLLIDVSFRYDKNGYLCKLDVQTGEWQYCLDEHGQTFSFDKGRAYSRGGVSVSNDGRYLVYFANSNSNDKDGLYAVPAVLDLQRGETIVFAETMIHTDEADEQNRGLGWVIWLDQ